MSMAASGRPSDQLRARRAYAVSSTDRQQSRRKEAVTVIISYRELARIRQREIARRAEQRRLEVHAARRRPLGIGTKARTAGTKVNAKSARAA